MSLGRGAKKLPCLSAMVWSPLYHRPSPRRGIHFAPSPGAGDHQNVRSRLTSRSAKSEEWAVDMTKLLRPETAWTTRWFLYYHSISVGAVVCADIFNDVCINRCYLWYLYVLYISVYVHCWIHISNPSYVFFWRGSRRNCKLQVPTLPQGFRNAFNHNSKTIQPQYTTIKDRKKTRKQCEPKRSKKVVFLLQVFTIATEGPARG